MPRLIVQKRAFFFGLRASQACRLAGMSCVNGRCKTLGRLDVYPLARREVFAPITVCVSGVGKGALVDITITGPGGAQRRIRQRNRGDGAFHLETLLPRGAPGRYRVRAVTPGHQYTRDLVVQEPKSRTLHVLPVRPYVGKRIQLGLVAYPANRVIPVHVYFQERQRSAADKRSYRYRFRYQTTVALRTDRRGMAEATLQALSSAPAGWYYLALEPGDWILSFLLHGAKDE